MGTLMMMSLTFVARDDNIFLVTLMRHVCFVLDLCCVRVECSDVDNHGSSNSYTGDRNVEVILH